ncbi:MFS transporter [Streptomyces sp. NPDC057062]|uniref:MFS transporter n=1 Tax=Streptomyces sp. NPDC057062 TaxID=3346011 RepID=UPI00362868B7
MGFTPVCVAGGVAALAAVVVVPGLPGRERSAGRDAGVVAGLRNGAPGRPTAVFATTAIGAGIIVTFLPVAVPASLSGLVAVTLFAQPAMATVARWFAGRYGDRHGPARLVLPGLLASSAGLLVTSVTTSPVAVLAGVAVFGAGFGVAQNATLTLMYARVPESGYGTVSALWNVAYDGGMGLGAVGFGAAAHTRYPAAFALTAAVMLVALVPAWRDR